jgi:hypothetical protein
MTVSPLLLGELNELRRGRQRVDQGPAAAASEVVLGLDDQGGTGDLRRVLEHGEPAQFGEVLLDGVQAVGGHACAEELGAIGAHPHLGRHDRGGDRSGQPARDADAQVRLRRVTDQGGCARVQERITQLAGACKVILP